MKRIRSTKAQQNKQPADDPASAASQGPALADQTDHSSDTTVELDEPEAPQPKRKRPRNLVEAWSKSASTITTTASRPTRATRATKTTTATSATVTSETTEAAEITANSVESMKPVAGIFKRASQGNDHFKWQTLGSLIVGRYGETNFRTKIASFDVDSTLVTTRGTHMFAKNASDWQFLFPNKVRDTLREHHAAGYSIVLFTNQGGLVKKSATASTNNKQIAEFKGRLEAIARAVRVPLVVLAATAKDWYRKPCPGMWEHFTQHENGGEPVDLASSFFVGDAAGRIRKPASSKKSAKPKNDFSDSDKKFALNIGIRFYTPELHFLGAEDPAVEFSTSVKGFNPLAYLEAAGSLQLISPANAPLIPKAVAAREECEVIVFTGMPGSGKSQFAQEYLLARAPGVYSYVNQDTLKKRQACVDATDKALRSGSSVIVDNTNPEASTRALYVDLARKHGASARCFHFTAEEHLCVHNDFYRATIAASMLATGRSDGPVRERLPGMAFMMYRNKFQEPAAGEGFSEIKKIAFVPKFTDDGERKKWSIFYS